MTAPRVVLAYSGGLDTSVAIRWLADKKGYEVIALAVDVGQGIDDYSQAAAERGGDRATALEQIRERALACGAVESVVVDAVDEFATEYVAPALAANALYMGKYPLVSALSRPLIVRHLVEAAREMGAQAVAHGCTGKGNDQVRFEVGTMCLAPDLTVEAPIREWGLSRDEAIRWAHDRDVPVPVKEGSPYSIDENLWGRTAECGILEDPWAAPPEDVFARSVSPRAAPDEPDEVVVAFEDGLPVALDGRQLALADLVDELDRRAGAHGVGRIDMIEDRLVGIKSREIYECPAAVTLVAAHRDLEDLCLEQELSEHKRAEEGRYAQLIYNGLWWGPLKRALDAFMREANRHVAGEVRMELFKGSATVAGRRSDVGLYDESLATYSDDDEFDHTQAEGFVKLWGLPLKTWARRTSAAGDAEA